MKVLLVLFVVNARSRCINTAMHASIVVSC